MLDVLGLRFMIHNFYFTYTSYNYTCALSLAQWLTDWLYVFVWLGYMQQLSLKASFRFMTPLVCLTSSALPEEEEDEDSGKDYVTGLL